VFLSLRSSSAEFTNSTLVLFCVCTSQSLQDGKWNRIQKASCRRSCFGEQWVRTHVLDGFGLKALLCVFDCQLYSAERLIIDPVQLRSLLNSHEDSISKKLRTAEVDLSAKEEDVRSSDVDVLFHWQTTAISTMHLTSLQIMDLPPLWSLIEFLH
jgi:hypothetical protein